MIFATMTNKLNAMINAIEELKAYYKYKEHVVSIEALEYIEQGFKNMLCNRLQTLKEMIFDIEFCENIE